MTKFKHFLFMLIVNIWKILPFKYFFRTLLNYFSWLKIKLYKDLRYKGNMTVTSKKLSFNLYNPGFTTIENEIFWNGLNSWERISIKIWQHLTLQSSCILDIGANSGIYSIIASKTQPSAEIYSFEPVKRTVELFKKNINLNSAHNIHLIEKAVSNINGSATFYDLPTSSQYSASLNADMLAHFPERVSYNIETIALDTISELLNKRIDLIKLDVEMHEPEALEGMINIIKRNQPYLLIEILTDDIASKIQLIFSCLDYSFYNIDEITVPKRVKTLTASDHYNYLFVPSNKTIDFDFLIE